MPAETQDRALGVEADAVGGEPAGEDPATGQRSVGVDVERGEVYSEGAG